MNKRKGKRQVIVLLLIEEYRRRMGRLFICDEGIRVERRLKA